MKKGKKLLVLAIGCVMIMGSTLVANAACIHEGSVRYNNPVDGGSGMYGHCIHCRKCGEHLGNSHGSDFQYVCYR